MRKPFLRTFFALISLISLGHQGAASEEDFFEFRQESSPEIEDRERVDDSDEGGGGGVPLQMGRREMERAKFTGGGNNNDDDGPQPAGIRGFNLEGLCFGNGDSFPLGPCSSTFLKCGRFNANRRYTFVECPLGNVFVGKECKPARKVRDCFLPEVNLLNDATEKIAQAIDFCARKEPFEPVLYFFDGPSEEDKCSRQALLCRGTAAAALAISCPSGKVFDPKGIVCQEAPDHCAFVPGSAQTPIRAHLLRLACAAQQSEPSTPLTAPLFPKSMQKLAIQPQANSKERCRNWYLVCEANDESELVFCDSGKMFDPRQRICRRISAEDRCPNLGACRGWEWRMSPVGECRPDFLYCNGMRPQLFQCERQGEVFKEGECQLASNSCDLCQPSEMKRSTEKCEEFFFCERDTSILGKGRTHWRQFICTNGRLFHPQRRECVQPGEYQCPTRTQCQDGESYTVECGDFFLCTQGRFVPGKCPDMTRWDGTERRCVFSAKCQRFQEPQKGSMGGNRAAQCLEGQTRPSADCKQFEECRGGKWAQRRCQEYASDRLKDPCRFCSSEPGGSVQQKDFYPVERLLPDGFNPFDGQGIKQKRCVEGEKIVNRFDCARFMECLDGDWFNLACPRGHFFSCVLASSANSSAVPMCQDLIPAPVGVGQSSPSESVHLLPLYSPNDTLLVHATGIAPGAGPLPELGDKELRENYEGTFDFCSTQSPQRIPSPYDCTKYRQCALDRGGYYAEKQCAVGTQFDPAQLQCTYNYTCTPSNCIEGILEPLEQCGKGRQCQGGKWHEFNCPHGMAFVGGKCHDRIRCQSTNPIQRGQCLDGHTRTHPADCSKYLLCRYGQFVEENCNLGHKFNPTIGRCDPEYACPAEHRPPCYEGEIRPITGTSAIGGKCQTDYELCRDGQFLRQSCPYGEQFAQGRCQVVAECSGNGREGKIGIGEGTVSSDKCKESPGAQGFRADRQDCAKFYQCAQGKWVPKDCAKGTVFNPTIGVCDWPANVPGC